MALADLEEHDDRWELIRLSGRKVDRIVVGYSVLLHLDDEPGDEPNGDWWISPGPPCEVVSADGSREVVDLKAGPRAVAPILELLHQTVASAVVWLDGRLEVAFESGARLLVSPSPAFEAWEVGGHDGFHIVCTPGGGEPALWPGGEDQITDRFDAGA